MFQLFGVPCFPRLCLWSEIQLPGTGWNSSLPGIHTETQAPGSAARRGVHPLCFPGHWAWKQLVGLKWIPERSKPTERKSQIPVADGSAYSFHLFSLHARRGYIINWYGDQTSPLEKMPAGHCGFHPREVSHLLSQNSKESSIGRVFFFFLTSVINIKDPFCLKNTSLPYMVRWTRHYIPAQHKNPFAHPTSLLWVSLRPTGVSDLFI